MVPEILLVVTAVLVIIAWTSIRQVTVFEYESGLRYVRGRLRSVVGPGQYWILPAFTRIVKVDTRPIVITVPGQEVLSADGVGLKVSIAATYRVTDARQALVGVSDYREVLYTHLQLALREIVGSTPIETLLTSRADIGRHLLDSVRPRAIESGLELQAADLKDIMFPGELKKVFSQVVKARQEGLASLERARGETAALRNLANAAGLVEQRPALMQLRALQALGQSSGNTMVLGLGGTPSTIPLRPAPDADGAPPPRDADQDE